LFKTDRNHNNSYLSNSPRAIQTNFQHSRAHKKYFSRQGSRRIDQRNNTTRRNESFNIERQREQISIASAYDQSRATASPRLRRCPKVRGSGTSVAEGTFRPKRDILLRFGPNWLPNPGLILLQQSRLLLNWKYFDDIVGCGFHAGEPGHPGPSSQA
jgi:hypothetical protein